MNFYERTASLSFDCFKACAAVVAFGALFKVGDVAAISNFGLIVACLVSALSLIFGYFCDKRSQKGGKNG